MQVKLLEPAECWFGSPKAMENSQIPADGCRDLTQIPFWERISFLGGDFGHQNPKWGKLLGQSERISFGKGSDSILRLLFPDWSVPVRKNALIC
mgnify:CR=1 FL=1|jgi:hypothetical protein